MKVLKFYLIIAFALSLVACGSGNTDENEVNLKVEGDLQNLGKYMTIEDDQVVVKLVEDGENLKIVSSLGVNVKKSVASDVSFRFEVEVFDKNHIKISDLPDYRIESQYDSDFEECHDILLMGPKRASMEESTSKKEFKDGGQEMWDKIRNEGVYISIKPHWSSAKYVEYNGSMSVGEDNSMEPSTDEVLGVDTEMNVDAKAVDLDDDTDETSPSESENSIDEILSEYEKFADDYLAFLKKVDANDPTAFAKIAEWTNKQTSILSKLEDVRGDMDMKHINRMNKINIKIMNAASKLKK